MQTAQFLSSTEFSFIAWITNFDLYTKVDNTRKQRNNILHNLWLFEHRNDYKKLRQELEGLAAVSNDLIGIFNSLAEEIGVDEVYEMML